MNEKFQKLMAEREPTILEAIAAHRPVVVLTVQEYDALVAKAEQNKEAQCLLGILRDLSGLSDQMKMMIDKAVAE